MSVDIVLQRRTRERRVRRVVRLLGERRTQNDRVGVAAHGRDCHRDRAARGVARVLHRIVGIERKVRRGARGDLLARDQKVGCEEELERHVEHRRDIVPDIAGSVLSGDDGH